MEQSRTKQWFDDDEFWRELYPFMFDEGRFDAAERDCDAILALASPSGGRVLDLCCGPGRFSVAFARRGLVVTGVDRTAYLLEKARVAAEVAGFAVEFIQSDMRDFSRPGAFDLVLSLFTSFGYFDDKNEDIAVLENIHSSLSDGGSLVLDVMSKERLARIFMPTVSESLDDGTILVQRHEIFDDWTRVRNEWILIRNGKTRSFQFHHTIYSGEEMRSLLLRVGFSKVSLYGDFDGSEFGVNARRLVAVARK